MVADGSNTTPSDKPPKSMAGDGDCLASCEAELTREVPTLLETMNRAAAEVNHFERQVSEAQVRHKKMLERWSRLYEDLRAEYGNCIDRSKPYFDAVQALDAASHKVQNAVREFSAAASQHTQAKIELRRIEEKLAYGAHKMTLDQEQQDGLSKATVRVLCCQQERDRREQEYACVLRECQDSQKAVEARRAQIGHTAIARATPCFRRLQQHQLTLATEQARITALEDKLRSCKTAYGSSMRELDRINCAVHSARKSAISLRQEESPPEVTQVSAETEPPESTSTPPELVDNDEVLIRPRVRNTYRTPPLDPVDDSPFT